MKKWFIAFVLLLALLVGGFSFIWWGPPKLRRGALGDITAAFAHDLHDYVLQHEGKLPADWTEFEKWETEKDGKTRWPAEVTARVMELLPEPDDALGDSPRYVRVIDPDIQPMEPYINRLIFNAQLQLGITNGAVSGAEGSTSQRAAISTNANAPSTDPNLHSELPEVLHITIGGFDGPSYDLLLTNGSLQYRAAGSMSGLEDMKAEAIAPTASQWKTFRASLDEIGVWNWKTNYIDPDVLDGMGWTVRVKYPDKSFYAEGANAYPEGKGAEPSPIFRKLTAAVSTLISGRDFQ